MHCSYNAICLGCICFGILLFTVLALLFYEQEIFSSGSTETGHLPSGRTKADFEAKCLASAAWSPVPTTHRPLDDQPHSPKIAEPGFQARNIESKRQRNNVIEPARRRLMQLAIFVRPPDPSWIRDIAIEVKEIASESMNFYDGLVLKPTGSFDRTQGKCGMCEWRQCLEVWWLAMQKISNRKARLIVNCLTRLDKRCGQYRGTFYYRPELHCITVCSGFASLGARQREAHKYT